MSNDLPPLPPANMLTHHSGEWKPDAYSSERMRAYARAAVAAERERIAAFLEKFTMDDFNRFAAEHTSDGELFSPGVSAMSARFYWAICEHVLRTRAAAIRSGK